MTEKCKHPNKGAAVREGNDLVRYCLDCGAQAVRVIDYYLYAN